MFDAIAPRYDLVNRIMTLRLDVSWRRRSVRGLGLPPGSTVADLACGTGDFCREIERHGCHALGFDLSMGMLKAAPDRSDGAPLVNADVLTLPLPDGSLDGATCGFALRNVISLPALFDELARVVRAGGRIALLEVDTPANPLLTALGPRPVLRPGGSSHRRGAVRSRRLPLPAGVGVLPAVFRGPAAGGRAAHAAGSAGFTELRHDRLSAGIGFMRPS